MALRCPECRVDLHGVANRTGVAAVCSRCGGIWLDNASSRSVMQQLVEPAVHFAARQVAAATSRAAHAQRSGGYRAPSLRVASDATQRICAECGSSLAECYYRPAATTLDVCAEHGTWFDAGELWSVTQHMELKALKDDAELRSFSQQMEMIRTDQSTRDFTLVGLLVGFLRR